MERGTRYGGQRRLAAREQIWSWPTAVASVGLYAATTTISLVAQWMMTRKILESWARWILVNCIYVLVLGVKHLYPTALLYALRLALAVNGLMAWGHSYQALASGGQRSR